MTMQYSYIVKAVLHQEQSQGGEYYFMFVIRLEMQNHSFTILIQITHLTNEFCAQLIVDYNATFMYCQGCTWKGGNQKIKHSFPFIVEITYLTNQLSNKLVVYDNAKFMYCQGRAQKREGSRAKTFLGVFKRNNIFGNSILHTTHCRYAICICCQGHTSAGAQPGGGDILLRFWLKSYILRTNFAHNSLLMIMQYSFIVRVVLRQEKRQETNILLRSGLES